MFLGESLPQEALWVPTFDEVAVEARKLGLMIISLEKGATDHILMALLGAEPVIGRGIGRQEAILDALEKVRKKYPCRFVDANA